MGTPQNVWYVARRLRSAQNCSRSQRLRDQVDLVAAAYPANLTKSSITFLLRRSREISPKGRQVESWRTRERVQRRL
jgi:hypothetical protein